MGRLGAPAAGEVGFGVLKDWTLGVRVLGGLLGEMWNWTVVPVGNGAVPGGGV